MGTMLEPSSSKPISGKEEELEAHSVKMIWGMQKVLGPEAAWKWGADREGSLCWPSPLPDGASGCRGMAREGALALDFLRTGPQNQKGAELDAESTANQ